MALGINSRRNKAEPVLGFSTSSSMTSITTGTLYFDISSGITNYDSPDPNWRNRTATMEGCIFPSSYSTGGGFSCISNVYFTSPAPAGYVLVCRFGSIGSAVSDYPDMTVWIGQSSSSATSETVTQGSYAEVIYNLTQGQTSFQFYGKLQFLGNVPSNRQGIAHELGPSFELRKTS